MKNSCFQKNYNVIFFKNYKLTLIKLARAINVAIQQGHHHENAPAITAQNFLQEEVIDEFNKCQLVIFIEIGVIIFSKTSLSF